MARPPTEIPPVTPDPELPDTPPDELPQDPDPDLPDIEPVPEVPRIDPDPDVVPGPDLPDDTAPVFDEGQDRLPLMREDLLPTDDENNILPGNDPLDEDPNDNGDLEQFDPEDERRRRGIGQPIPLDPHT